MNALLKQFILDYASILINSIKWLFLGILCSLVFYTIFVKTESAQLLYSIFAIPAIFAYVGAKRSLITIDSGFTKEEFESKCKLVGNCIGILYLIMMFTLSNLIY